MWLWLACALAADPIAFTPEAQVRPRLELDSGRDGVSGAGNVQYITMRSRLGATLSRDDLALRVVVQDVRFFGEELNPRRDFTASGLDVRIATFTWSPGDVEVEVGRMERGLYNERLLAISAWRQPGRSLDGARVAWSDGPWAAEARALLLSEGDTTDLTTGDQVYELGSDAGLALLTGGYDDGVGTLSPLVIYDYDLDSEVRRHRATPGVLATLQVNTVDLEAEAYGQFGTDNDVDVVAGMVSGKVLWHASPRTTAGLSYALLSGDGDATDDQLNAFNTLQGANHRYYGHIDMAWFVVGGQPDEQGLQDLALHGTVTPVDALELRLDLHGLFLSAPDDNRPFLAIEPDLEARAKLTPGLTWNNGVNLWFPEEPSEMEWMVFSMLDARL